MWCLNRQSCLSLCFGKKDCHMLSYSKGAPYKILIFMYTLHALIQNLLLLRIYLWFYWKYPTFSYTTYLVLKLLKPVYTKYRWIVIKVILCNVILYASLFNVMNLKVFLLLISGRCACCWQFEWNAVYVVSNRISRSLQKNGEMGRLSEEVPWNRQSMYWQNTSQRNENLFLCVISQREERSKFCR